MNLKKWQIENLNKFGNTILNDDIDPEQAKKAYKKLGYNVNITLKSNKTKFTTANSMKDINFYLVELINKE